MALFDTTKDVRKYHLQELYDYYSEQEDPAIDPDVISPMITQLQTETEDSGRTYKCPKCNGEGRHLESLDTGNEEDDDLIRCTMEAQGTSELIVCDGYGYTTEEIVAQAGQVTYVKAS